MAFEITTQQTLLSMVRTICSMVGYVAPADAVSSSDPIIQQMITAVNQANTDLRTMREGGWQELIREGSIPISAPAGTKEASFDLPEDFWRFVDQSQWSQNTQLPGVGPVSPQGWMRYLVRTALPMLSIFWQVRDGKLWTLNPPASPANFVFMYHSIASIQDADNLALYKNIASKNADKFLLDGYLITLLGRQRWLEYKGFDSSAAARDFSTAFDQRYPMEGAPVLSLTRSSSIPFISVANTPDTNFGAS